MPHGEYFYANLYIRLLIIAADPLFVPRLDFDKAVPFADVNEATHAFGVGETAPFAGVDASTFAQNSPPASVQPEQLAAASTANSDGLARERASFSSSEAHGNEIPQLDDFKVEYHPSSEIPARTYRFDEYETQRPAAPSPGRILQLLGDPWHPFHSRDDFEFAEVVLEAGMSHKQISRLLEVVKRVQSGKSQLSFKSHNDITTAWQRASHQHARVQP